MGMTNDGPTNAAKLDKARPRARGSGKSRKGRKAVGGKNTRQKATQSRRKVAARNFKLSREALAGLRAKVGKGFINPYRAQSNYHACIAALRKLGAGRFHPLDKIVSAVVIEMGEAADAFKTKTARKTDGGADWQARIVQNIRVLARADYGAKLRQVGYQVRADSERGAGLFKLIGK